MTASEDTRVWQWKISATFNPEYDVTASAAGLEYYCEIQGPFCGYDRVGAQTWAEFVAAGPLEKGQMPASIAAEIRAYALSRHFA